MRALITAFLVFGILILRTPLALAGGPSVGEVTLSVGVSQIQREGRLEAVSKGMAVLLGDVIRTTASGHVHVRFVDGARLSVRPESVLHVQVYRYDAARPRDSMVKFYLETGTVREISGLAAESAREGFRLNTPLVAIGVKGTDFVTQATSASAVVLVNQGAIVLAPLDAACRADGFGPCGSSRAKELTASMIGMALVYRQAASDPVLQPVNSLKGADQVTPLLQQEHGAAGGNGAAVANSKSPAAVQDVLVTPKTLTWGRWAANTAPGDALTVPFMEALQGNMVTVGDGYYFLFRRESNVPNLLATASGVTAFSLQGSAASYKDLSGNLSTARVDGGALSIDFTHNTFNTQLSVSAQAVGTQPIAFSGSIDPSTGIFLSSVNTSDNRVAGAVSLDTRQAGYLFSKPVGTGALVGATLWGH